MPYADPQKQAEYSKAYRAKHRVEAVERAVAWGKANPQRKRENQRRYYCEHIAERRAAARVQAKEYRKRYPEKAKAHKARPHIRLQRAVSLAVWRVLKKGQGKREPTFLSLGYAPEQLVRHLERQFAPEMTWENYGVYWQIDHIRPLREFDTTKAGVREAWALSNLRPLSGLANRSKGGKRVHLL